MKISRTQRGLERLETWAGGFVEGPLDRIIAQQCHIPDRLWVAMKWQLNREEVSELARRLNQWVETGSMFFENE